MDKLFFSNFKEVFDHLQKTVIKTLKGGNTYFEKTMFEERELR